MARRKFKRKPISYTKHENEVLKRIGVKGSKKAAVGKLMKGRWHMGHNMH